MHLFLCCLAACGGPWGSIATYGQVGDAFGSLNALFTGLGILGLIYTIQLQQKQIEEQAKEGDRQAREMFPDSRTFNAWREPRFKHTVFS